MQREVVFALVFVGFALFAPLLFEDIIMFLIFGGVATLAMVGLFFAGKEVVEKPDAEGSLPQLFRAQPIRTAFNLAGVLGLAGFALGLFLALLGFEPTTANGTKLWILSGGFGAASMACGWVAGKSLP